MQGVRGVVRRSSHQLASEARREVMARHREYRHLQKAQAAPSLKKGTGRRICVVEVPLERRRQAFAIFTQKVSAGMEIIVISIILLSVVIGKMDVHVLQDIVNASTAIFFMIMRSEL